MSQQPPDPTGPGSRPPGQPYPYPQAKTNGLAIASLVLGIIWIYWLGSILAVVFGHISLSQIGRSGGQQQGRGMAIAGLVLGYIGIGTLVLTIALAAANRAA